MERERVWLLDSTMRDGAQGKNISFSVEDKVEILRALDRQGIPYIEAGNPSSGPKDLLFFERARQVPLEHSKLVAFGATCRKFLAPQEDRGIAALCEAGTPAVCIFGKSWDLHVKDVLKTTLEENLRMIGETVAYLKGQGKEVLYDAEHFFDGYRQNPRYAMETVRAARDAGADWVVLCDTNGATLPSDVRRATQQVCRELGCPVGIHCHNDIGCAVAASLAAVEGGARMVQGTYVGFGERCGNANLSTVLPTLQLKMGHPCVEKEQMARLTKTARIISDVANLTLPDSMPYVGGGAFSHKAGMHVDAVHKNSRTFEHISPDLVGNKRHILISEVGGKAVLYHSIRKVDPTMPPDAPEISEVLEDVKARELRGYQYESAEASLQVLILKHLGMHRPHFKLELYRIFSEQEAGVFSTSSAICKVRVGDQYELTADEGRGPFNALDNAVRKAVTRFYPAIARVRLTDYKVRVVEQSANSASRVRVLIESTDGENVWTTVGVSHDIIRASLRAQVDSLEYKLLRDDGIL
ncbi:citramalate synthase [Clostridium sp. ATCC 29733]|uniref:citramalate synthase n=1 Tax=Clostridium sp. (strain ATCC 29733 / VPI C48-50) TaxID=1507 RepID=UPI000396358F|nr:citramalate synthase [Clostridium sp. ATCC 29733]ERI98628.1 2-isopropylmalate synthase/homocitrate synthase family protein [Clostridium sp. ATCC 29733]